MQAVMPASAVRSPAEGRGAAVLVVLKQHHCPPKGQETAVRADVQGRTPANTYLRKCDATQHHQQHGLWLATSTWHVQRGGSGGSVFTAAAAAAAGRHEKCSKAHTTVTPHTHPLQVYRP